MHDKIKTIAERYQATKDQIQTEEAAKNALIMPFIAALGYDVFNPLEVLPECVADIGAKKGERIDYAIKHNGEIALLIECKRCDNFLDDRHRSQLFRYFAACDTHLAVLTNGLEYHFFADIDKANKMDESPFFVFNILGFDEQHLNELKRFSKAEFNLENILATANDMLYRTAIKKKLGEYLHTPSDAFVRAMASDLNFSGRMTQQTVQTFANIVQDAFNQFIKEKVRDRLTRALEDNQGNLSPDMPIPNEAPQVTASDEAGHDGIITTQDEMDGYAIIKAIAREIIPAKRVTMRDAKSYCAILLDDNNRKPICRLYFNSPERKRLAFFNNKQEKFTPVSDLDDLYNFADQIKATIQAYDSPSPTAGEENSDTAESE